MSALTFQNRINTNIERWHYLLNQHQKGFAEAKPFPHLIIDDFLPDEEVLQASHAFPKANEKTWTNYIHVNEKKYGLNKRAYIPAPLLRIIDDLQSDAYLKIMGEATQVPELFADETLAGAGLHQMYPGGFLNIHSDFLIHPVKRNLKRRINLILFLSEDWKEEYGGELELWNKEMTACEVRIQPKFNRCVIFITDEYSYHGCPEKLLGPKEFSRKSLALYYYIEYKQSPLKQYTDYKARPEDGNKKFAIYLDNRAVALYSWLKQKFNLNDDFVSKLLRLIKLR